MNISRNKIENYFAGFLYWLHSRHLKSSILRNWSEYVPFDSLCRTASNGFNSLSIYNYIARSFVCNHFVTDLTLYFSHYKSKMIHKRFL